jgi:hypothetical protein
MAVAVRLSEEIVKDAQKYASLSLRSVPKQIEYWYRLGKIADENPDLPLDFIKGVLEGKQELEGGEVSAFSFRPTLKPTVPKAPPARKQAIGSGKQR